MNEELLNPREWFNTRFLDNIPKHFTKIKFEHIHDKLLAINWLEENTTGRFAIEKISDITERNWTFRDEYQIGFENPAEATMYAMFFNR